MPWLFRKTGIGSLVGKRTWGGLVGHYTNPVDLIDDGFAGTPNLAFYTPDGTPPFTFLVSGVSPRPTSMCPTVISPSISSNK